MQEVLNRLQRLESRSETLEKENRYLRRAIALVLGVFVCIVLFGITSAGFAGNAEEKVVKAHRFVLVDDRGVERASLEPIAEFAAALDVWDSKRKVCTTVFAGGGSSEIILRREVGSAEELRLGVGHDGPQIKLTDKNGTVLFKAP